MTITNSTSPLALVANDAVGTQKSSKLHDAAQQFEALMIGEMLKTARESGSEGWLGSGGGTGDDSAMGMAESQLANALAASGGLGLSRIIEQSVRPGVKS
jgi:Rod binding domain-containing protein